MNFKHSLRTKILAFFSLAVLIPILIVSSIIVQISRNSLWNSIKREQTEIVSRVGERINSYIDNTKRILKSVASRDLNQAKPQQVRQIFINILELNNSLTEITLIDRNGMETVKITRKNTGVPGNANTFEFNRPLTKRSNREEFNRAMKEGYYVSPLCFSEERTPYIFISASGEGKKCVILCKLNLTDVWDIISRTEVGKNGYAFVVDANGLLVAHPEVERVIAHTDFSGLPIVRNFLDDKPNEFKIYKDETGQNVVSFFYSIPRIKWGVFTSLPYKELIEPVNTMINQAFLWLFIFSAIFMFLGMKFASTLLNPLNQLKEAANEISAGKFDINLSIESGDEIEALAKTFNHMAGALKELEQMRQDLISMIVHDMKSPLSGIIGSLDYILSGKVNESEQKEIFGITKKSADSLYSLIQNLLDVSRMEDGKMKLNAESVRPETMIGQIAAQFSFAAQTENKIFSVETAANLPDVKIDTGLINRVLTNLVYNSLHHTAEGGRIWIKTGKTGSNTIRIEIGDDGVGIPEEYKNKIFEKFVQVERKRAHLRTGTGLGLTFCKMAIELHNGRIWVESEEGKGSRFIFTIPTGL